MQSIYHSQSDELFSRTLQTGTPPDNAASSNTGNQVFYNCILCHMLFLRIYKVKLWKTNIYWEPSNRPVPNRHRLQTGTALVLPMTDDFFNSHSTVTKMDLCLFLSNWNVSLVEPLYSILFSMYKTNPSYKITSICKKDFLQTKSIKDHSDI